MSQPKDLKRRKFLIGVGAGGAGAAALIAVRGERAQLADAGQKKAAAGGYQVTEHVRNYYRTARV